MSYLERDPQLDGRPIAPAADPLGMEFRSLRRLTPVEFLLLPHRDGLPVLPSPKAEEQCWRIFGRLTLLEFLVISAIAGVLAGLVLPEISERYRRREQDLQLSRWSANHDQERPPNASLRAIDARCQGDWYGWPYRHPSSLVVEPAGAGSYQVRYANDRHDRFDRTATVAAGVLTMDRPVEISASPTEVCQTFYAIRVRDQVSLVPAYRVVQVEGLVESLGVDHVLKDGEFQRLVYTHRGPATGPVGSDPIPARSSRVQSAGTSTSP